MKIYKMTVGLLGLFLAVNLFAGTRLEDCLPEHQGQIQTALRTFREIPESKVVYVSTPITSGQLLYAYMETGNFPTAEAAKEDKQAFYDNVIKVNIKRSEQAAALIPVEFGARIIEPAKFEESWHTQHGTKLNWGQNEFMAMWILVIREKVTHLVLLDGWEYSNGSAEEYLEAVHMQMGHGPRQNIEVLRADGAKLERKYALELLVNAFLDISARGIEVRNMAEILARLVTIEGRNSVVDHNHMANFWEQIKGVFADKYPDIFPMLEDVATGDLSPMNVLFRTN